MKNTVTILVLGAILGAYASLSFSANAQEVAECPPCPPCEAGLTAEQVEAIEDARKAIEAAQ